MRVVTRWSARLLDNVVGDGEDGGRYGHAQRLRGAQIDHELESRQLHRQIGGWGAFEDLVHVPGGAPVESRHVGAVGHQAVGVQDRKSTRLDSSHEWTSYAVFCLKKKR